MAQTEEGTILDRIHSNQPQCYLSRELTNIIVSIYQMVSDSGSKEKEEEMVNWMEINEAAPLKVGELAAAADRKGICCKRARERGT